MNNFPVLKTAQKWIEFLKTLNPTQEVTFDLNPVNGGSFEYAKPVWDDLDGQLSFRLTEYTV